MCNRPSMDFLYAGAADPYAFHCAEPLHTHPQCRNPSCRQMRRCSGGTGELLRCSGCLIHTYCSKECQKAVWPLHKIECRSIWAISRARAEQLSGNPNAWSEFTRWAEYHHTTLTNFTINNYLSIGPGSDERYVTDIYVRYQNKPGLPFEKRFKLVGWHMLDKDAVPEPGDMFAVPLKQMYWLNRPSLVPMGRMQFGDDYRGTAAYIITVDMNPETRTALKGTNILMYPVKAFAFDADRADAHPAPDAYETLGRILAAGERLKFCCGKIPGIPKCCCGGWTHHEDVD